MTASRAASGSCHSLPKGKPTGLRTEQVVSGECTECFQLVASQFVWFIAIAGYLLLLK